MSLPEGFPLVFDQVSFRAAGVTSRVYEVRRAGQCFALRVAKTPVAYLPDASIRRHLKSCGLEVAAPVTTHHDFPHAGVQWSLDEWLEGRPAEGPLPARVCVQIGKVLRSLHELKGTGQGRLRDSSFLKGVAEAPESGLHSRWRWAFPFAGEEVLQNLSEWEPDLHVLTSEIIDLNRKAAVVLHSDLHHQQFLCLQGQLSGVLDFADSMLGARSWDLAHFLYFHGEACTASLLEGYGEPSLISEARILAVSIATHYVGKAVHQQRPDREAQARNQLAGLLNDRIY